MSRNEMWLFLLTIPPIVVAGLVGFTMLTRKTGALAPDSRFDRQKTVVRKVRPDQHP